MTSSHKYNMGVVGNCSFIAYIDHESDVKWLCFPRFDSSFIFGGLLDSKRGGEFYIKPASGNYSTRQYYRENTNILITEFTCSDGSYRVIDYAPRFFQFNRYFRPLSLFRKIEPLKGNPLIRISCKPVYEYGQKEAEMMMGSNHIRYSNLGEQVRLTSNVSQNHIVNSIPFVLSETKYLTFTYGIPLEAPLEGTAEDFLSRTTDYWTRWIKATSVGRFFQEHIIRSALVLKLHQYEDTGGIIASGTTSLPEHHGSGRNWDYRYCWLRDTYYTLTAFNNIGHFEELERYLQYVENIIQDEEGTIVQPLYSILGEKKITEIELDIDGYLGNKPVRIGNAAYTHIQNDVYGQVLASLLPLYTDKRLNFSYRGRPLSIVRYLLKRIQQTMSQPDAGIWEFRNSSQVHCYTLLFHWVGSHAGYKIASEYGDKDLASLAKQLIALSTVELEKCYNPSLGAYAQATNGLYLDASCLQLISLNYLPHDSERAQMHLRALEKELRHDKALFFRYLHRDDFGKPSSTFLICAFWYVEALACVGRLPEAMNAFEELLRYSNHLGLFSEDVATDGSQWGNFPQTYSHVGLMNAAYRIERKLDQPIYF